MRECVDFFAPYPSAAKLTGEVRKDLDVEAADEWCARILFSLFSTPSSALDTDNPTVVADFVRAHMVQGFASDRPRRGLPSTSLLGPDGFVNVNRSAMSGQQMSDR